MLSRARTATVWTSGIVLLGALGVLIARAQQTPPPPVSSTRPPDNNEQGLRPLTPEEIAPNLNFYAMDPLYVPGTPLGWASERIRETLDRGVVAIAADAGQVYLSWRLLDTDPANVRFNVYRTTGGGEVRLNATPIIATTDFVDAGAATSPGTAWRVSAVVNGRELPSSTPDRWTGAPLAGYKGIRLRDDVRSVDRVGVGDLNGDGAYDFVVKHPSGSVDPGRQVPSKDTYKIDGVSLWDARSGTLLFGTPEPNRDNQIAGGLAGDIDPSFPGMEVWGDRFFFTSKGQIIPGPVPPQNELVWWDGDLLRELHSRGSISKWKGSELGRTEGSLHQVADLLGDWREEIVTFASGELRVYSTALRAIDRRVTLMQDPLYCNDVTHRSMGYPHVPLPGYYLGVGPLPVSVRPAGGVAAGRCRNGSPSRRAAYHI